MARHSNLEGVMRKLGEFLQDAMGDFSSKRLFALACFVIATVALFQGRPLTEYGPFLAAAVAVFIGQAATGT